MRSPARRPRRCRSLAGAELEEHPFESRLDGHEEYPVEGGPRFSRPALIVRAGELRGTARRFTGARTDGDELRLGFDDSLAGLRLALHYRMRAGHDVVGAHSFGQAPAPVRLRGLAPDGVCVCRDTGRRYGGTVLLHHGLRTSLSGDLDATVIRLRRDG
ncbi:hypothetical protein GCM10010129_02920 [Streptomyces fumigatiscleroticus]|nr:hypothetical protein GCM10010129_02920 [Streptomyces fumigatiscleroticus]